MFKWPWSSKEYYEGERGRGRSSIATDTDLIGIYIKNLKEASDRLEGNVCTLKGIIPELYKVNRNLVKENRELNRKLRKYEGKYGNER